MRLRSPGVIGRDQEVARITAALADARGGRARAVFITGEPGIGKTRLAELATDAAADSGMVTSRGRMSAVDRMLPLRPLTEALQSISRRGELPDPAEFGAYRHMLAHLLPEWGGDTEPHQGSMLVLAEGLLRLLARVGRGRGILVVLEDFHDADPETLGVVEYLVDNLEDVPVAAVFTLRPVPSAAFDLVKRLARGPNAVLLPLSRLDAATTGQLAAAYLGVDRDAVPPALAETVWADSAGIPFIVEEILDDLAGGGHLVVESGEVHFTVAPRRALPESVVRSVGDSTLRLGPEARAVLELAAVMGQRFSLAVTQRASGLDERSLVTILGAGVSAQLVTPGEPAPDWYAFRHPLTAEALVAGMTPTERRRAARAAVDAVEQLHPDLPGDWCTLAADLHRRAGDDVAAGTLFLRAGRQALAHGAVESAVTSLQSARRLLAAGDPARQAEAASVLLDALGQAGRFDEAVAVTPHIAELAQHGLAPDRVAHLHAQLANVARVTGHWDVVRENLDAARAILRASPSVEVAAAVDMVGAHLELVTPNPDRLTNADALARRAAEEAEQTGQARVACDAWQLLGVLARERDLDEAIANFARSRQIAETHRLLVPRLYAEVFQAGTVCLATGSVDELNRAHANAVRAGAVPLAYEVSSILALQAVLRGEYDDAGAIIDEALPMANRLHLGRVVPYLVLCRGVLAAHRVRREEMAAALDQLTSPDERSAYGQPLSYGLARAFCALLEEDREQAEHDLALGLALEAENPTTFHLAGRSGLNVLLGVLAGRGAAAHVAACRNRSAGAMRWNRLFLDFADAVVLGAGGEQERAAAVFAEGRRAAALFPLAEHLGLRLVAEPALRDGWGTPVEWLREAEAWFHARDIPAVASKCRGLMRGAGATVQQRRGGSELIPEALRQQGITAREHEVVLLMADRIGNKEIAGRLHISPRTVEKHVASVLAKTQQADRESFARYAREVLGLRR